MKKLTIAIIAIALVAVGAIFVFGQTADTATEGKKFGGDGHHRKFGKGGKRGMRGHRGMGMMFRGLDLTDAQKEQMKSIAQSSRESTKSLHEQMRTNRQQLEQLSENGNFNESQVQALAQQQGALQAQLIVERERVKSQMYAVLTAEQKAKAAELKAQFKQKMQERMQKRAERKAAKDAQE
ncbi:MAG: Spy/CpxP family protein refolding chaperone [Pyrinomonadaceae bacterium]